MPSSSRCSVGSSSDAPLLVARLVVATSAVESLDILQYLSASIPPPHPSVPHLLPHQASVRPLSKVAA